MRESGARDLPRRMSSVDVRRRVTQAAAADGLSNRSVHVMPARRSLTAVPGVAHLNRAGSTRALHAPARRPRAAPLGRRVAARSLAATHGLPWRQRRSGGPCRRVPGGFMTGAMVHEDASSALRRWTRRRFD